MLESARQHSDNRRRRSVTLRQRFVSGVLRPRQGLRVAALRPRIFRAKPLPVVVIADGACGHPPIRFDAPLRPHLESVGERVRHAALGMWMRAHAGNLGCIGYPAVIDARALDAQPGTRLDAVLNAARCFRSSHAAQASLTLLLPVPEPGLGWQLADDADAVRMLVATLAAEWGAQGLRVNALELAHGLEQQAACATREVKSSVLEPGLTSGSECKDENRLNPSQVAVERHVAAASFADVNSRFTA
jgi:hypothetical protein